MKFRLYLFTTLFTVISFSSFAQTDTAFLSRASTLLLDRATIRPIEKVYLHLDKPYYIPGDTIWFKAYTVVGNMHQLSALSGVLYCELISNKDSVVNRRILKLTAGLAWGDFILPHSIKQGNYHIRAYTNWMRNAGTEYFYNQMIRIGGPQPVPAAANQITAAKPDVQFFPEGGELVNGVRSRVAVKSINANGLGADIKGVITDNDNNEVAVFETQHLGMGVFALIPQPGKTYKAIITGADSSKFTVDLPKAQEEGFTLAINNNGADSIYVKVAANDKLFQTKQNSIFYVVAQSGGKVYYTARAQLRSPVFTTRIAKTRFPSGIVQFTLFSQNGEPLNERIIFIQHDDLKITLSPAPKIDAARQKVKFDISTKATDTGIVRGSFSVAVINESRVAPNESDESTILNNLLLTSDVKGYIEQPNYYFTNTSGQTQMDLDVLMLTQGYRRFEWAAVLNNTVSPIIYQPENSLELAGSLKTPSGKPAPNGKVIFTATRENFLTDTTTDKDGNFRFANLTLPDTAKVILRAKKANNGDNVMIYVKQIQYPPVIKSTVNTDTTAQLTPQMLANLAEYKNRLKEDSVKNARALKGVVIKDKAHRPDRYNNYGTALEYDADMKRLNGENSLEGALPMLVPGANYRMGKISYEFHPARLIIDGLQRPGDQINLYSPTEIDNIRMISSTFTRPAMLVVTTKRYAGTDTAATQLKGVEIKERRAVRGPDLAHSANLNGPGNADQIITGKVMEGCIKLSDCLNGKVFGVKFLADGTPINNRDVARLSSVPPMVIIVDGAMLPGSSLNDLNGSDIYSVEVLRSAAYLTIYGSNAPGGALVITTKRGGDPNYVTSVIPSGLITLPFKGFYKAKTFYSPKYTHPKTDTEQPDLRSTIYWNPNIITGKDGKASFEYFNNDTKGTYRVVIEGIDDNGNLGRQVYKYNVE